MSLADDLKKLQELLQEGLITPVMFDEERDRLMRARRSSSGAVDGVQSLGAYRVLGVICEGGMGAVYRARHSQAGVARRQGGDVAIKVMHPQYASRPEFRRRFDREADLGLRLDHPNVVKVS